MQEGKMAVWGDLRKEEKRKGKIYSTEIARKDKKAFLSEQCKEIEENNRMGKTRDLFKKIGDTKEHFMQRWHSKGHK